MRRPMKFDLTDDAYVIREEGEVVFQIPFQGLRFDSKAFYLGLYAEGKSANIVLENAAIQKKDSKAAYVYKWLNEIIQAISNELPDDETADDEATDMDYQRLPKRIVLFDMAVCAGRGDFIEGQTASEEIDEQIETNNLEADYALRISGESMEPTLHNGCIVLVKRIEEPEDTQVVVVNVDGNTMVKRYCISDGKAMLVPDNKDGRFETIPLDGEREVRFQGLVLETYSDS